MGPCGPVRTGSPGGAGPVRTGSQAPAQAPSAPIPGARRRPAPHRSRRTRPACPTPPPTSSPAPRGRHATRLRPTLADHALRSRRRRNPWPGHRPPARRIVPGRGYRRPRARGRPRPPPDLAQQRRCPRRHLLRPRLAQGEAVPARARPSARLLRPARAAVRRVREAGRGQGRQRGRAAPPPIRARYRERRAGTQVARIGRAHGDRAERPGRRRAALA